MPLLSLLQVFSTKTTIVTQKSKHLNNLSKFCLFLNEILNLKTSIMAKGQDTKKTEKKEPLKTAKEKKADKRDKKAKRD